jgi:hypothetical protein
MGQHISEILLWLFIINLGIALGAGLYEKTMIIPQWFIKSPNGLVVNSDAMRQTDTGRKFWAYVTTVPLTILTLANLVVAWQSQAPEHYWWLGASLITLTERIATFTFFIPTAIKLMHPERLSLFKKTNIGSLWVSLNYIRLFLNLIGWLAALRVLSLLV